MVILISGFRRREAPSTAVDKGTGNIAITWTLDFEGKRSNMLQRYSNNLTPIGNNIAMKTTPRDEYDITTVLKSDRGTDKMFNVWTASRNVQRSDGGQSGTGYDIWANVVDFNNPVNVKDDFNINIRDFYLYQNYPNPFNPTTNLSFVIGHLSLVTLKVYDVLGREIAALINEERPEGYYEVQFDASGLASGIYIYRIQAGEFSSSQKMILLK
jgi:hypothetical protein